MILVAIGSNLEGPWGSPHATVARALAALDEAPLRLVRASQPIVTAPYGRADQPDYVNAVAEIDTSLDAHSLLEHLHGIEHRAGRRRTLRWGPRTLDLDLLDYHGRVTEDASLVLPHPGIACRSFVLGPIAEIAPAWRHPVLGQTAGELLVSVQTRHGPGPEESS